MFLWTLFHISHSCWIYQYSIVFCSWCQRVCCVIWSYGSLTGAHAGHFGHLFGEQFFGSNLYLQLLIRGCCCCYLWTCQPCLWYDKGPLVNLVFCSFSHAFAGYPGLATKEEPVNLFLWQPCWMVIAVHLFCFSISPLLLEFLTKFLTKISSEKVKILWEYSIANLFNLSHLPSISLFLRPYNHRVFHQTNHRTKHLEKSQNGKWGAKLLNFTIVLVTSSRKYHKRSHSQQRLWYLFPFWL